MNYVNKVTTVIRNQIDEMLNKIDSLARKLIALLEDGIKDEVEISSKLNDYKLLIDELIQIHEFVDVNRFCDYNYILGINDYIMELIYMV